MRENTGGAGGDGGDWGAGATGGGAGSAGAGGMGGGGGAPLPDPKPLRVLNWNVLNFLNDKNDSDALNESISTTAEYTLKRKAIGAVLKAMDPDIAVLAEVENEATLADLVATELAGKYTAMGLVDGNDSRAIDIGIISKIPIDKIVTHKDDSFVLEGTAGPSYRFSRDCPEYHVTFNGRKLVLLGAHFKAKVDDLPAKRLAEAQRTRAIANALFAEDKSRAVVVLGDYNDTPGSPPYLAVIGKEPSLFKNAPDLVPSQDRYSYTYQGKYELIDHQMSNPLLAPMLDVTSVVIRHGNDVADASDHSPVMATYNIQ